MDHEEAVIRAFILPARRERYLTFLKSPRKRTKFRAELPHFKALNPKFVVSIPPSQQNASSILNLLNARGAGSRCWVISEDSQMDGREWDLEAALSATMGQGMGTFISCIPGKLAYFENEDVRHILQR